MPTNPAPAASTSSGSWIPALVSTLVTVPFGLVSLFFAGLSPMACDSCNGAEADRFDASFEIAFPLFGVGLVLALILLIASWVPPRRPALALAAPLVVLVSVLLFMGLLDTP
ncbi:hypothetical protein ACFYU9_08700 [Streptomyces sp. NPDC004327]|uniref:hypothetical protein n=1 Tax=unclassified Streptomyces TaxID=2593676 RepID=UPI0036A25420